MTFSFARGRSAGHGRWVRMGLTDGYPEAWDEKGDKLIDGVMH